MKEIYLIFIGAVATVGFAILFQIRPRFLPVAFLGGAFTCGTYFLLDSLGVSLFLSNLCAALVSVVFANIMARVLKVPAIVFVTCCIISLVPGGALFGALRNVILGDNAVAWQEGKKAVEIALGIAGGIAVETSVTHIMDKIKLSRPGKKQ